LAGSVLLVGERILVRVSGGIEESIAVETGGGGASGQTVNEAGPWVVVSKSSDREAGGLGDKIEPADDGGFGAAALAGHLGGAEEFDAVEAEYSGDGRRGPTPAGIELFQESKGGMGDADGGSGGRGRGWGRGGRRCPG